MDALLGGAALGVVQVRGQGLTEGGPPAGGVQAGQDRGVHVSAERGAVRGGREVVVHGAGQRLAGGGVAEALEHVQQPVGSQEVDEHEDVGLFGELVPVGGVAFGLQDQVQAPDVAVGAPVVVPVQLGEVDRKSTR